MQLDPWSKMLYVHIPRTGGSWFTYSWRMNYDKSGPVLWYESKVLMDRKHNRVTMGRHGKLSGIKTKLKPLIDISDYKVITLVRDPIDRIISSWKWFSIVKDTAKKHGWTSIDDMLDEYQSGEKRVNYLPQTYWLCEQGAKFDHIFKFEDLLKGPKQVQKVFPEYNPKGKLKRTLDIKNITNKNIKRIKEIYKEDIRYLRKYYDY